MISTVPLQHVLIEGLRNLPRCPSAGLGLGCRGAAPAWQEAQAQQAMLHLCLALAVSRLL